MTEFTLTLSFLPSAGMEDGASMGMLGDIVQDIGRMIAYSHKDDGDIIDRFGNDKLGTWKLEEV